MFLEILQNLQENTCARVLCFIKIETLAQTFSCEFREISKNTFLTEHVWAIASMTTKIINKITKSLIMTSSEKRSKY